MDAVTAARPDAAAGGHLPDHDRTSGGHRDARRGGHRAGPHDIDWADGVLVVTNSKFGKSREVPLDPTTIKALARYAQIRDRWVRPPTSPAFFVSRRGTPMIYSDF